MRGRLRFGGRLLVLVTGFVALFMVQVPVARAAAAVDLSLTVGGTTTMPRNGAHVLTYSVRSFGGAATGVHVDDLLPSGATLVSVDSGPGSVVGNSWTVGAIPMNGTATLQLTATVDLPACTVLPIVAHVSGDQADDNPSNNTVTDSLRVAGGLVPAGAEAVRAGGAVSRTAAGAGAVAHDVDGNVYTVGSQHGGGFYGTPPDLVEVPRGVGVIAKYSPAGDLVWVRTIVGNVDFEDITVAEGKVVMSGFTYSTAVFGEPPTQRTVASVGQNDGFAAVYTTNGDFVDVVHAGTPKSESIADTAIDGADLVITGRYGAPLTLGTGASAVTLPVSGFQTSYVARFASDGTLLWAVPGVGGGGVAVDHGTILVTGPTGTARLGVDGVPQWKTSSTGIAISVAPSGDLAVADGAIVHVLAPDGRPRSTTSLPGGTVVDLTYDDDGGLFAVGVFRSTLGVAGTSLSLRSTDLAGFLLRIDRTGYPIALRSAIGAGEVFVDGVTATARGRVVAHGTMTAGRVDVGGASICSGTLSNEWFAELDLGREDPPPTVGGHVTGAGGPLAGIVVTLVSPTWSVLGTAVTDANGDYLVDGLAPGPINVRFYDPTLRYQREWYLDQQQRATGATLAVPSTGQVVVDADLAPRAAGAIAGRVTKSGTSPAVGIVVQVFSADGFVGAAVTNENGRYRYAGLVPGTYHLRFVDPSNAFPSTWWRNAPTRATSGTVDVAGPVLVDAVLLPR